MSGQTYRFEEFSLDKTNRRLLRHGEDVVLSAKAFDLLQTLVENQGRLVSKDELFTIVWGNQVVEESNLTVHISQIRKALGETGKNRRFIETVPGFGYRFVGKVISSNGNEPAARPGDGGGRTEIPVFQSEAQASDLPLFEGNGAEISNPRDRIRRSPVRETRFRQYASVFVPLILILLLGGWFSFKFEESTNQKSGFSFVNAKTKQLTTKGRIGWAAISPDGKFYTYALNERGEYKQSLWLGQTDNAKDIQLRPAIGVLRGIAFSADGKTLFFTVTDAEEKAENGFFRIPVLGGVPEKLPLELNGSFAVSPDEKQVAFVRQDREKNISVVIVAAMDGTSEREIATRSLDAAFYSRLAWSPDGTLISVPALSESEKKSNDVFVIRPDSGKIEQLSSHGWLQIHNLIWHPDGKNLIVVAIDKTESLRHLWLLTYPAGKIEQFSRDTDTYGSTLSFSADGNSLIVVELKRESNIWTASSTDFAKARQISFSSINGVYGWEGIEWLPGNRLVFTAGIDRTVALLTMNMDGTGIRQITTAGFYDRQPKSSPDGRTIFFESNRSGAWEIWAVSPTGADLRQITAGGALSPQISPDGKWIVYASKNMIWRMVEGGSPVRISDKGYSQPSISPDGRFIACRFQDGVDSKSKLIVLNFSDGSLVKSFEAAHGANFNNGIRWAKDRKAITYRDSANGVWKQNFEGGPPEKLTGLPEEKIYSYAWSPDGNLFAFTRGREISDVVLITTSKFERSR
jgi:eukaryotic-like serine/threonine-protein kinase